MLPDSIGLALPLVASLTIAVVGGLLATRISRTAVPRPQPSDDNPDDEQLRLMKASLECVKDGVLITDARSPGQPIIYVNPSFSRLTGYSAEEALGKNPRFLRSKDSCGEFEELQEAIENGTERTVTLLNQRKDGIAYWNELTVKPLRDAAGEISHWIGVQRNVTQLTQARLALAKMGNGEDTADHIESCYRLGESVPHTLMETALDMLEVPILLCAVDGRVRFANGPICSLLGRPAKEIEGHLFEEFEVEPEVVWDRRLNDLERRPLVEAHINFQNAEGNACPVDALFQHLQLGNEYFVCVVLADSRDRHRLEDSLRKRNQELRTGSQAKSDFMAQMSHELRTPLNSVLMLTEALEEGVYGELTAPQLRAIGIMEDSGSHLLSLINDILDLSKIEAGKLEIARDPVDIRGLCDQALRLVEESARAKRINVRETIAETVGYVWGDEIRLRQVLVNLLSNAIKFTKQGSEIGLEVGLDLDGSHLKISVWDHGIGIAEENLSRIFKPFEQVLGPKKSSGQGTGLGLTLVKQLVELHGGRIEVHSEVGAGTRFTVILPEVILPRISGDQGSCGVGSSGNDSGMVQEDLRRKILVADDNQLGLQSVCDFLKTKDFQVFAAENGKQALELAERCSPELILMDIQMPEVDGLQAIRTLRRNNKLRETPIIAITALAMTGDRERCLKAGADDYLSKPISLKGLLERIRRFIEPVEVGGKR